MLDDRRRRNALCWNVFDCQAAAHSTWMSSAAGAPPRHTSAHIEGSQFRFVLTAMIPRVSTAGSLPDRVTKRCALCHGW